MRVGAFFEGGVEGTLRSSPDGSQEEEEEDELSDRHIVHRIREDNNRKSNSGQEGAIDRMDEDEEPKEGGTRSLR